MSGSSLSWLFGLESLARIELKAAEDFADDYERRFTRQGEELEAEEQGHPPSYWEEEVSPGYSRGDLLSDRYHETKARLFLSRDFALITTYSVLERVHVRVAQDALSRDLVKDPNLRKKKQLYLQDCVQALEGLMGNRAQHLGTVTAELEQIRIIRNAIVHDGGWITHERFGRLRQYGYELGQRIELKQREILDWGKLAHRTCRLTVRNYRELLHEGA